MPPKNAVCDFHEICKSNCNTFKKLSRAYTLYPHMPCNCLSLAFIYFFAGAKPAGIGLFQARWSDMHPRIVKLLLALAFCTCSVFSAAAQTGSTPAVSTADQIAKLQAQVTAAQSGADNAWMLVSAALVLMMTGPGLALFYSGLVRKKNVLGTMMQSFAMMAIITV